ncbi:30S ribosome-binding factor RbfA [Roseimaritima ulvae]|uniref:Ribosome-binding factor A n=1 Tax=Roseimaritima ulvae TaxID=980254 RepID=A0A5B9QWF3_9BACT|nr:30S ribosome-binding factor RbfA [Roseimaritima ulvae]QEG43337.1 Ribosome-binding factor A [Roseimaritima ulvae]
MTSRRLLKAAEAIREVVATAILTDLRDPRIQDVTVVGVKVSADMREAKVLVSVRGDEAQERLSLRGLQHSAGFLQAKIADRIDSRYIPKLRFEIDKGTRSALEVGELLDRLRREREAEEAAKAGLTTPDVDGEGADSETEPATDDAASQPADQDNDAASDDDARLG